MTDWKAGMAFDSILQTPLDFYDVTYANGHTVRYEKERPHGEWKIDSEYGYIFHCVCSKCNTDVMKYISGSENWWLNSVPYFCPNCGADMRKEGDEK